MRTEASQSQNSFSLESYWKIGFYYCLCYRARVAELYGLRRVSWENTCWKWKPRKGTHGIKRRGNFALTESWDNWKRDVEKLNPCSVLEERPVPLKVSLQDLIHCASLTYGRLTFVVLNPQPAGSTAGCSFPHQLACIAANLLCVIPRGAHVPDWPAGVARGVSCVSSRNCVAINSIRKRLRSLKLNVALLFWHFFVKSFLHFSDWSLSSWSCLQVVGAQSSCPWYSAVQCSAAWE